MVGLYKYIITAFISRRLKYYNEWVIEFWKNAPQNIKGHLKNWTKQMIVNSMSLYYTSRPLHSLDISVTYWITQKSIGISSHLSISSTQSEWKKIVLWNQQYFGILMEGIGANKALIPWRSIWRMHTTISGYYQEFVGYN